MTGPARRAVSRRRALFGLAGTAALGAACPATPSRPATPSPPAAPSVAPDPSGFRDDFAGVPDGPLEGRIGASGHRWRATEAGAGLPPVVAGGAGGPPPGFDPGPAGGPTAAGYGTVELTSAVRRVGAEFRWDASRATSSAVGIGAFTRPVTDLDADRRAGPLGSSMHLAIRPDGIQFAVFSDLDGFSALTPEGGGAVAPPLDPPLRCDGVSVYRTELAIVGDACRVSVDDRSWTFRDPRIATVPARFPFFEYFCRPGGTNLPRFVRVWGA